MARSVYLLFGVLAYFIFFGTFLYLIAFVGNLPHIPLTVDEGGILGEVFLALIVDIALIAIFGLQHSIMARPSFKEGWTKIVPHAIERSTYLVFASLALILLFAFWRPIPVVLWDAGNGPLSMLLWGLFGLGWLTVLISTFLISHFELFGLKQVWSHLRDSPATAAVFRKPLFYKFVRHPMYTGFLIAFWAIPQMTLGHLVLTIGMSAYILIAIGYEEKDLVNIFGRDYEDYRKQVGKLAPRLGRGA